jgi:hypothetical protein
MFVSKGIPIILAKDLGVSEIPSLEQETNWQPYTQRFLYKIHEPCQHKQQEVGRLRKTNL